MAACICFIVSVPKTLLGVVNFTLGNLAVFPYRALIDISIPGSIPPPI